MELTSKLQVNIVITGASSLESLPEEFARWMEESNISLFKNPAYLTVLHQKDSAIVGVIGPYNNVESLRRMRELEDALQCDHERLLSKIDDLLEGQKKVKELKKEIGRLNSQIFKMRNGTWKE